ncbi:MAG: HAMP domain-containing protein [Anaerolineae bacterium]|jgi:signal transduction histidine kinase|nr:HAMP domain-containing protein [Anaerolineae bacterium]
MRLPVPHSLYARLTLSHLLVAIVSIGSISIFASTSIITASREQVEHHMEDLAFATSNALEEPLAEFLSDEASLAEVYNSIDHLLSGREGIAYTLYLVDGTPLFDSNKPFPAQADFDTAPEVFMALQDELGEGDLIRPDEQGEETFYIAVRIEHENKVFGVLRLSTPLKLALASTSLRRLLALLLASAILITLGVGVVGWALARNLARPIEEITAISERLRAGDLEARVTPAGPQELHLLAETFNNMANRLQGHMAELRVFVANASHELRTPLTSVKLRAEALRGGALNDAEVAERFLNEIEDEVDRLGAMVNDLLDISRLEAGMESNQRNQVDLGILVEEVSATFNVRAERKGVRINIGSVPDLPTVLANEDQLRRVFTNLLDNALKNLTKGGKIDIQLHTDLNLGTLYIDVADTGRGIAEKDLPHIFERFYRVEATLPRTHGLSGSGLGLAIAKSIIELHRGEISVTSKLTKGTTFHIKLPVF